MPTSFTPILRGDTLSAVLTGLGDFTGWTRLWFTLKQIHAFTDAQAQVQIVLTNPGAAGDGLSVLNGAPAVTPTDGAITVQDQAAGNITITLKAAATAALLSAVGYYADIQVLTATGIKTLSSFSLDVTADVTRAVA